MHEHTTPRCQLALHTMHSTCVSCILAISEWQTVEYICTFTYVQTHVCSVNVLAANFYVLHKVLSKTDRDRSLVAVSKVYGQ